MTPQHTRNVFHRAAYPSNAVDDSDISTEDMTASIPSRFRHMCLKKQEIR